MVFHNPKLFVSTPLNHQTILTLFKEDPTQDQVGAIRAPSTQEHLEMIHGLYLRHEQDARSTRIDRFKRGDIFYLQQDIGCELRVVLKRWKALWKKVLSHSEDSNKVDLVHLQWASRTIKYFQEELHLLGTAKRREQYISSIVAYRVELPEH
jgi:hypothetical protein